MKTAVRAVLDASAILALILGEPGAERLTVGVLENAIASTVNVAEAQSKLVREGYLQDTAWEDILAFVPHPEPFSAEHAKLAGSLIQLTRSRGLSIEDRSCLALAITLGASVYTTDRAWQGLDLGVAIHIIR